MSARWGLVMLVATIASACGTSHEMDGRDAGDGGPSDGTSDGGPLEDGGDVVRDCYAASFMSPGTRCAAFEEPCRVYWDYWMGRCGYEEWRCEGGRLTYENLTGPCELPGPPTCEGYVPVDEAEECRLDTDCAGSCAPPGDTSSTRMLDFCPRECETDADCGDGVCLAYNDGVCHACGPRCTETSCGPFLVCADDGRCVPQRCDEGYRCYPTADCAPGTAEADEHGCIAPTCTLDFDCICGACVLGRCALGPGHCVSPAP